MPQDALNEREFELVNIVGAEIASNQRDLSKHMDLSLGMTNMLVKRLIAKGYIRIRQLNKRKVEYFLTPKGFAEKMRKSVRYTMKTLKSIGLIKERLKKAIVHLRKNGEKTFFLIGDSDLVALVEMVFKEEHFSDCKVSRAKDIPKDTVDGTFLICTEEFDKSLYNGKNKYIDLIEELSKQDLFLEDRELLIR